MSNNKCLLNLFPMTYKLYIVKGLKPSCITQDEGNEGDTCARMQGNGKKKLETETFFEAKLLIGIQELN